MPVRQLDSFLVERNLFSKESLEELRGTRIGIDGQHWLRNLLLRYVKEPLCSAMGGIPLSLKKAIEKDMARLKEWDITPFFVFNGLHVIRNDKPFASEDTRPSKRRAAWSAYEIGKIDEAASIWLSSGTVGPAELTSPVIKFLKNLGVKCMRAPFSSWAQLSYMDLSRNGHFHAVYAGSELLMFKTERVIVNMDFEGRIFEWIDKTAILQSLGLTEEMFMEMCILAGFDYCPTFPLFTEHGRPFNFTTAYQFIKQYGRGTIAIQQFLDHPLLRRMNYMEAFLRACSSIKHHIIFDDNSAVVPLFAEICPSDLHEIFGPRLPDPVYYYLVQGLVSPQVINNFVSGFLIEGPPLCSGDTFEYREFLRYLLPFRARVIGLLSQSLNPNLASRNVSACFWFEKGLEHDMSTQMDQQSHVNKFIDSDAISRLKEKTERGDSRFLGCLRIAQEGYLTPAPYSKPLMIEEIIMNSELRLLHDRQFIDREGNLLAFGKALNKCSPGFQDEMLVALELIRAQVLNNKAPHSIDAAENLSDDLKKITHIRLISRVVSLLQTNCSNEMWRSPVDRELLCFNSTVKALYRTLRNYLEMSVLSMSLQNRISNETNLDHVTANLRLPFFHESSTAMGILMKAYLVKTDDPKQNFQGVVEEFPNCLDIAGDLQKGFSFWTEVLIAVRILHAEKAISSQELKQFEDADAFILPLNCSFELSSIH